ncbi:hypothetical protein [Xanthobacter autotrophicus]|uniref:hypothetical protein n=1 Tax=Xanthobacter autotrophicus TaxID=280 RepID=UPI0037274B17
MSNPNDPARPRFYRQAVQNKVASEREGRPIFEDREMVEVIVPGDKLSTFVSYVTDAQKERWPEHYAAFKRGESRAATGTPLEHWPILTTSRVAELKAMNIMSVDELAAVNDSTITKMGMGARELREQARAFLDAASAGAGYAAISAENERLRQSFEALQAQVAALTAASLAKPTSIDPDADGPEPGKPIEDCTDAELKAWIKKQTGEPVRGNPSRETLLERAATLVGEDA